MQPLKPQLVLPQVTDGKYWREGGIRWIDNAQEYFAQGAEYLSFRIFANGDKVKLADIRAFDDLLKPQYKGKIASSDPTGSAGGRGCAEAIVAWRGGEFMERFYKGQAIAFTKNPVQLVEWAARGTYPLIIGSLQQYVDKFTSEGFNIQYVAMSDWPTFTTGGRSVVKMAAKAPHPAAAAVFANWYLSRPGQERLAMTHVPGELRDRLRRHRQEHVLAFWDRLDDGQRRELVAQLQALDFEQLGRLYESGRGVPKSAAEAQQWYSKAAKLQAGAGQ